MHGTCVSRSQVEYLKKLADFYHQISQLTGLKAVPVGKLCTVTCVTNSKSGVQKPKAKQKQWTETQMLAATNSVQNNGLSDNRAADLHGVPCSTLEDRLSGRVIHGTKSRPKMYSNFFLNSACTLV